MGDSGDVDSKLSLSEELARIIAEVERSEEDGEPTNSQAVQDLVKRNIATLEKLTRWVSQVSMFSENEDVSEIPAGSLRFLLLPGLLGFLTGKLVGEDRLQVLQREQVYYQDFLKRLQSYGTVKRNEENEKDSAGASSATVRSDLSAQARSRQTKIERYKEKQNLLAKLDTLRQRVSGAAAVDEDLARELYLTELKFWAGRILDSMEMVQQEIEMLRMRDITKGGPPTSRNRGVHERNVPSMKPFIITRTEMQKAVYGMGYPSIPTMSLEEFFDQKLREGQIQAINATGEQRRGPITEEEEKIMREEQEEREHPEVLQHDREYDEYKDDHRRGWGSVHNKG